MQKDVTSFLGMEIRERTDGIMFNQGTFINKIVEKFRLTDAKTEDSPIPVAWKAVESKEFTNNTLYSEIVGQLMYIYVW